VSTNPAVLTASELFFSYGTQKLLEGVTLAISAGEKIGLVGRNGCGKTSLLKILAGENAPDGGEIARRRGLRIGFVPQEFDLRNDLTVGENINAGAADILAWIARYESGDAGDTESSDLLDRIDHADGWNLDSRLKATATALEVPPFDTPVARLSGGEKRRVALCRALASQPDLLLLDEPTNHLDAESISWLEDFLRNFAGAVIFVTHDRYFLDTIATRVAEISDGRIYSHPGNYTAYLEAKVIRQQIAEQSERRRQRFLRGELEWVRAGVRAQRSKAKHRLDTFYKIEGMEAPPEEREMDLLIPPPPEIGNVGVELVNVGAKVPGPDGDRWLFENLTLSLPPGQCTGIVGRNGAGKTTLLRLCLGERDADEGVVTIGKKVKFNYIDQIRMQLNGTGTVMQEVADGSEYVAFGEQRLTARAYLKRFLFSDERVTERVDRLSGGERARLMLAKVLRRGGNALVLDEPTNDLDLQSLRMLEEALADFDGIVLVVSHDRYFLDRICDQIVAFEPDGVFVQPGNYSYYLEKKKGRAVRSAPMVRRETVAAAIELKPAPAPKPRKLTFREQQELDGMEATILQAESEVAEVEQKLADPQFFVTSAAEAPEWVERLELARKSVARLYSRWEELARTTTPGQNM